MKSVFPPVYIGGNEQQASIEGVDGEYVCLLGETFYKIANYDRIPPFFMSLVSSSNHWLFIASTGGLSAGRINADHALFPYYTVDKLTENNENTGAKAIFVIARDGKRILWEPLSKRQAGIYAVERNLYKNIPGNVLVFEEINQTLGLTYRYAWSTGDRFGFIKSSSLINFAETACAVEILDGLQNLLPANVSDQTQNTFSPLLDAYKRSELDPKTGMGVHTLNSTLTDLAEPSESLLCSVSWQAGLDADAYLISSRQLDAFREGRGVQSETETRGQRGAYFVHAATELQPGGELAWKIVADVDKDAAAVVNLGCLLQENHADLMPMLDDDLSAGTESLKKIVACADGLQSTNHPMLTSHHFANVLFNEMRGGYFPGQYVISSADFKEYVASHSYRVYTGQAAFLASLPDELSISEFHGRAAASGVQDLVRLANSYLPLAFSRRHGDPSRPWNRFSINIKKKDGSQQLDYEGNWRDIFQNWEALAYSYPEYVESMISVFLNATTADGYNPYRITRKGINWEIPEPNNPWANIGYWSDHQIIYLLKLMEISHKVHPNRLGEALAQPLFCYANLPYRIKPYAEMLHDPFNTISIDWDAEKRIEERVREQGNDGKLLQSPQGEILYATLAEKLLTLLLAKIANLVPEGGLWMNTQRPEWNDANNALVGKGLSVVTLAYLRRTIVFCQELLEQSEFANTPVHSEVGAFFKRIDQVLTDFLPAMAGHFGDVQRRRMMDALGMAGSDYRCEFYSKSFSGKMIELTRSDLAGFFDRVLQFIDHTLRANRREDGLYHAYNILHLQSEKAEVSRLYEMLEGQVAILSSGLLSGEKSLALLTSMRSGPLYRADQHSYILYPDRALKGFVVKNQLTSLQLERLQTAGELIDAGDASLFVRDENGNIHFAGHIHNIKDVRRSLERLTLDPRYSDLAVTMSSRIEEVFEETFHHDQFTGRSGTFFAYEGLGSIYWHMVSKLVLAVQETILRTRGEPSTARLIDFYNDLRAGQCFNKTPAEYGAFPTDPYSHTPAGEGAKQPGMSGMVKEEILARQAELGFTISKGCIEFDFLLFDRSELFPTSSTFEYLDSTAQWGKIEMPPRSLAYTVCQVPVILQASTSAAIQVYINDGSVQTVAGSRLDIVNSRHIFERDGTVHHLVVQVPELH